jgi:uncharacterized membrane protein YgaE (UPF0421/DUF939 family)
LTTERPYKLSSDTILDAARTTVAAVSAIVIIESTINPRVLSWQRFAGTALGALIGAIVATFFPPSALVYAGAILLCGVVCAVLRVRGAYRFAAITLSIILLIAHESPAWIVALHRFVEVSLGIAVALVLAELWPRRV